MSGRVSGVPAPQEDSATWGPDDEQRAVVFRSEDGREVTFGLLYDALVLLRGGSYNDYDREYAFRRLAEALGVKIVHRAKAGR